MIEGDHEIFGLHAWKDLRRQILGVKDWKHEFQLGSGLQKLGHELWFFAVTELNSLGGVCKELRPDVVFQYCEAIAGDRQKEIELAQKLESMGIAFTGESSRLLVQCKDKFNTKRLLAGCPSLSNVAIASTAPNALTASMQSVPNVSILPSVVLDARQSWAQLEPLIKRFYSGLGAKHLVFKPNKGEASENLLVVKGSGRFGVRPAQMLPYFERLLADGYREVIVEPYLHGLDLSCGVMWKKGELVSVGGYLIKPKGYEKANPMPYTYNASVKFSEAEQKKAGLRYYSLLKKFPDIFEAASGFSLWFAREVELDSYMRIDFRLDAFGNLFFLEANPNPSLGKADEFALAAKECGLSYCELLHQILNNAYVRLAKASANNPAKKRRSSAA